MADKPWQNDNAGMVEPAINGELGVPLWGCPDVNPCDPDPEMILTVTGPDGSGVITWCNQTWDLDDPGSQSGEDRSVCPTVYQKQKGVVPSTPGVQRNATHRWEYVNGTAPGSLKLRRRYNANGVTGTTGFGSGSATNTAQLRPGAGAQARNYRFQSWLWTTNFTNRTAYFTTTQTLLGMTDAGTVPFGRYTGTYDLLGDPPNNAPNSFFGSHTIGGVTYTWRKGAGWP